MNPPSASRMPGLLAYDDMRALDIIGPLDVFGAMRLPRKIRRMSFTSSAPYSLRSTGGI